MWLGFWQVCDLIWVVGVLICRGYGGLFCGDGGFGWLFCFGFGGLEFRGIVIVGCCYYGWRRLWLWFCDGFSGYGSGCYGWLWLW